MSCLSSSSQLPLSIENLHHTVRAMHMRLQPPRSIRVATECSNCFRTPDMDGGLNRFRSDHTPPPLLAFPFLPPPLPPLPSPHSLPVWRIVRSALLVDAAPAPCQDARVEPTFTRLKLHAFAAFGLSPAKRSSTLHTTIRTRTARSYTCGTQRAYMPNDWLKCMTLLCELYMCTSRCVPHRARRIL